MEDFGVQPRLVRVSREHSADPVVHRRLHMSEDQEMRSGGSAADEGSDEEVRAHVRSGRGATDEGGEDEVKAHVKSSRGMAGDDGDGDDDVRAHVKSSRS
jgi:hypothetical protein